MKKISANSVADIQLILNWSSDDGDHEEVVFSTINFWRDLFPPGFRQKLIGKTVGDVVEQFYPKSANLIEYIPKKRMRLQNHQFDSSDRIPRAGRFYPGGLLRGVTNIFPQNVAPFRIHTKPGKTFEADLNAPLAGYDFTLKARILDVQAKKSERGGTIHLVLDEFSDGPGMQVRARDESTDFYSSTPFARDDATDDAVFYQKPRLVSHIDATAKTTVFDLYSKLAKPDMAVMDLMSSWESHLPTTGGFKRVTGVGMNAEEMGQNPSLTDFIVHDLNKIPELPFPDDTFDMITCTVSVEYLTQPDLVFKDVARVLRPGGIFVVTFSNRWFQPKTIGLWPRLHEFERLGLVMDYFIRSKGFKNLRTLSSRRFPRPESDKYYDTLLYSDPVYAVWGEKQ